MSKAVEDLRSESIGNEDARLPTERVPKTDTRPVIRKRDQLHGVVGTLQLVTFPPQNKPFYGAVPSASNPIPTLALRCLLDQNDDFAVGIVTGRFHRYFGYVPAGELKEAAEIVKLQQKPVAEVLGP
ncbi:hypothetical protein FRC04_011459 [Tulasnella sp. 424]|nr:hypothetical protein FRC04_011459 [Tulasnella sp. 424]